MLVRCVLSLAVAAALGIPALALGEVGPHSTWYAVHKQSTGTQNNINIVVQRNRGVADVNGINRCLGTSTPQGSTTAFLNSFDSFPVPVRHGAIHFRGRATVSTGSSSRRGHIVVTATLLARKAVGTVSLPGTSCGTIHFVAPVALVRK